MRRVTRKICVQKEEITTYSLLFVYTQFRALDTDGAYNPPEAIRFARIYLKLL